MRFILFWYFSAIDITRPFYNGIQYGYPSYVAYERVIGLDMEFEIKFKFSLPNDWLNTSSNAIMIYSGKKGSKF